MSSRRATHAGSWYSNSGIELNKQLGDWLSKVTIQAPPARAIISPHAGYSHCGACAAFAYKQVDPANIKRVFILGPSHYVSLAGCALTQTATYQTPLYDLKVDQHVNEKLLNTGKFVEMDRQTDEEEHSIEMQLPYIAKVMESRRNSFTVVPILVGRTSLEKELMYGKILSPYLASAENLFVISSDFCHWGKRFGYTYCDKKSNGEIYQHIEELDRMGMSHIESLDTSAYYEYLDRYSNTICGRRPIGIFLNAVNEIRSSQTSFKFHKYVQSNRCRRAEDSSVSYAAGSLTSL